MPKVSVVIPCYNLGSYIDEAVNSVISQTYNDYEIIIVNDGSTDEFTNILLCDYNKPKTKVIHTYNQGLASARNTGISAASGEYILPLDADDLIERSYLEKTVSILDKKKEIGVVSCLPEFFEAANLRPELPPISLENMLKSNQMIYSSLYRRVCWERCGGYNANMKYGWEDWDFWLSLLEKGVKIHRIPEVLFYYRIRESSMLRSMTKEKQIAMYVQMFHNHKDIYNKNIHVIFQQIYEYIHLINSKRYRRLSYLTDPMKMIDNIKLKIAGVNLKKAALRKC